jgi:hypothetical protein
MPDVLELDDSRVERKRQLVRQQLITLHNHSDEMSKSQIVQICHEIVSGMIDLLEMLEIMERTNG